MTLPVTTKPAPSFLLAYLQSKGKRRETLCYNTRKNHVNRGVLLFFDAFANCHPAHLLKENMYAHWK